MAHNKGQVPHTTESLALRQPPSHQARAPWPFSMNPHMQLRPQQLHQQPFDPQPPIAQLLFQHGWALGELGVTTKYADALQRTVENEGERAERDRERHAQIQKHFIDALDSGGAAQPQPNVDSSIVSKVDAILDNTKTIVTAMTRNPKVGSSPLLASTRPSPDDHEEKPPAEQADYWKDHGSGSLAIKRKKLEHDKGPVLAPEECKPVPRTEKEVQFETLEGLGKLASVILVPNAAAAAELVMESLREVRDNLMFSTDPPTMGKNVVVVQGSGSSRKKDVYVYMDKINNFSCEGMTTIG